jgi:hypothetical protein
MHDFLAQILGLFPGQTNEPSHNANIGSLVNIQRESDNQVQFSGDARQYQPYWGVNLPTFNSKEKETFGAQRSNRKYDFSPSLALMASPHPISGSFFDPNRPANISSLQPQHAGDSHTRRLHSGSLVDPTGPDIIPRAQLWPDNKPQVKYSSSSHQPHLATTDNWLPQISDRLPKIEESSYSPSLIDPFSQRDENPNSRPLPSPPGQLALQQDKPGVLPPLEWM